MKDKYIGKSIPRVDGVGKVTGEAKYVGDLYLPGMLYGKIFHSTIAHGIIEKINTDKAKALKGVAAVLTYEDVPNIKFTTCGHPLPNDTPLDSLILGKKIRYYGEPIALVAAESLEIAEEALKLIEVTYNILPAYFTIDEASDLNAIEIHENTKNIADSSSYIIGNPDKAFAEADYVFEDEINLPIVAHSPIENFVSLAYLDDLGDLVIHSCNQSPNILRRILAFALNMPISKVRIIKTLIGGGFGGKQEPVHEQLNAVLTLATRKPVKLEYTREETISITRTRHSMIFKIKTGLTKDGRFIARELNVKSNTGAYSGHGHSVCGNISGQFADFYPSKNMRFSATTYYTNILTASAMRGYGIPQLCFATESHIDNIAYKMNMDPLELRRINFFPKDYKNEKLIIRSYALPEILETGRIKTHWDEKRKSYKNQSSTVKKGIGVAFFSYKQNTYNHGVELASARVTVNEDGTVYLGIGACEIGQGSDTVLSQIAASTLGVSIENIKIPPIDTAYSPFDLGAYASRQTTLAGIAVKKASLFCKQDLIQLASKMLLRDSSRLDIEDDFIFDTLSGEKLIGVKDVAEKTYYNMDNPRTIVHEATANPDVNAQSTGATFAEVAVDTKTGRVEVINLVAIMDSGKIINPVLAEGQVLGGHVMSFGYGLMEQILIDPKTGKVLNDNLLDYKIPTMADTPPTEVIFIETDEPSSPYGNKSLGEPANIPPAAAIRNAIFNALNIKPNEKLNQLPLTPQRILQAIKEV